MSLITKSNLELATSLAQMTGYFGGIAQYDELVPKRTRIRMLNHLIELWSELDPDSPTVQEWIARWKNEIIQLNK